MAIASRTSSAKPAAAYAAFVSHASADAEKAQEVVEILEAKGFRCWVAPRDIRAGHEYAGEIIHGIENSRCLVLLLSQAANESPFVRREVERAVSKRKPVFPMRVEEVMPSPALELFVSSSHWIDAWSGSMVEHVDHLARDLADESAVRRATAESVKVARRNAMPKWIAAAGVLLALVAAYFIVNALSSRSGSDSGTSVASNAPTSSPSQAGQDAPSRAERVNPAAERSVAALQEQSQSADSPAPTAERAGPPTNSSLPSPDAPSDTLGSFGTSGATRLGLKLAAEPINGVRAPTVVESFPSPAGQLRFDPLIAGNIASIRYRFDEGGDVEVKRVRAGSQNRDVLTNVAFEAWTDSRQLKLTLIDRLGKEIGPFIYALPDRKEFIVDQSKQVFLSRLGDAIQAYAIPAPDAMPKKTSSLLKQLSFAGAGPCIACRIKWLSDVYPWVSVKEVHLGTRGDDLSVIAPTTIDLESVWKQGESAFWNNRTRGGGNLRHAEPETGLFWHAVLPAGADSIYAQFVFRDGTKSKVARYRVDKQSVLTGAEQ